MTSVQALGFAILALCFTSVALIVKVNVRQEGRIERLEQEAGITREPRVREMQVTIASRGAPPAPFRMEMGPQRLIVLRVSGVRMWVRKRRWYDRLGRLAVARQEAKRGKF